MKVRGGQAPPFRRPSDECVVAGDWMGEDGNPLPIMLPDWDPATTLSLRRALAVDTGRFAAESGLDLGTAPVEFGCSWSSSATRLRGIGPALPIELDGLTAKIELVADIPGDSSGGRLRVDTIAFLQEPASGSDLKAARRGSILWSDRANFTLEGAAERFPINIVDFNDVPSLNPSAGWILHWPSRAFDEPFGASIRLLINSSHEELVEAVRTGSDDRADTNLRSQIHLDTARALVTQGLMSESFIESAESYEEGTVGEVVFELIGSAWADMALEQVATRMREEPARFESELQGRFLSW